MAQARSIYHLYEESFHTNCAILEKDNIPFEVSHGMQISVSAQHGRYITQFMLASLMIFENGKREHLRFATTGLALPEHLVNKTFICPIEASIEFEKLEKIDKCFYYYTRNPGAFVDNQYTGR